MIDTYVSIGLLSHCSASNIELSLERDQSGREHIFEIPSYIEEMFSCNKVPYVPNKLPMLVPPKPWSAHQLGVIYPMIRIPKILYWLIK